jgi:hypothetical protein
MFRLVEPYIPQRGTVCLVQRGSPRPDEAGRILILMQYALAPRLVLGTSTDCEFVIVYGSGPGPTVLRDSSLQLVHRSDDELMVFRRMLP